MRTLKESQTASSTHSTTFGYLDTLNTKFNVKLLISQVIHIWSGAEALRQHGVSAYDYETSIFDMGWIRTPDGLPWTEWRDIIRLNLIQPTERVKYYQLTHWLNDHFVPQCPLSVVPTELDAEDIEDDEKFLSEYINDEMMRFGKQV